MILSLYFSKSFVNSDELVNMKNIINLQSFQSLFGKGFYNTLSLSYWGFNIAISLIEIIIFKIILSKNHGGYNITLVNKANDVNCIGINAAAIVSLWWSYFWRMTLLDIFLDTLFYQYFILAIDDQFKILYLFLFPPAKLLLNIPIGILALKVSLARKHGDYFFAFVKSV